ncbi:hypothetical protein OIU74_013938 [Salix koriyanagi]|uniref:Uncharacterized protein n=1 Tax=Salix koriyanagi TaxID=2511006 RepID=A0A9Q0SZ23_9ROSI|nr:hypothetical protein OIU74_013938 [Salix koriyanagi]
MDGGRDQLRERLVDGGRDCHKRAGISGSGGGYRERQGKLLWLKRGSWSVAGGRQRGGWPGEEKGTEAMGAVLFGWRKRQRGQRGKGCYR